MSGRSNVLIVTLIIALLSVALPMMSLPAPAVAANGWTAMAGGTFNDLYGVWGSSSSNVYAVGAGGTILHNNGAGWSPVSSGTSNDLSSIWGSSANNVFAVGAGGLIIHYDGTSWSSMASGTSENLTCVWGLSPSNIYATGLGGTILQYNGQAWSAMETDTSAEFYGIWGSAPNSLWAVGAGYSIFYYDGTNWESTTRPLMNNNQGIWGASASQIFIVGWRFPIPGYVRLYDGSFWNPVDTPPCTSLYGVYGFSGNDVYAVGGDGAILHYDGQVWSAVTSGTISTLRSVWGSCPNNIFAVGSGGAIVHYVSGNACLSSSASVRTNLGSVSFSTDTGSISHAGNLEVADTRCAAPSDYDFPYGLFSLTINNLTPGATARVTITFPAPVPSDYKYYKCINGLLIDFTQYTTLTGDRTLVLTITDGGRGDADGAANGIINDPGGPAFAVAHKILGQGTIPSLPQAPAALPSIAVKSASLSASRVTPGTPVTVTANVVNSGTANGAASIKLYVNSQEESSQGVAVASGRSVPVTFSITRADPGAYSVYVGGTQAGSFVVDQFADPNIILFISGAAIFFAFIIGAIYIYRKR